MHSTIRKHLFEPLAAGNLSLIVPDFVIEVGEEVISVPAKLTCSGNGKFHFTLHFMQPQFPSSLRWPEKNVMDRSDQVVVRGQIEGEILFRCNVFPPVGGTTRSRGTSTMAISASRMELPAEETDTLTTDEMKELLGQKPDGKVSGTVPFSAHLVFHGPKLRMDEAGTEVVTTNDFLGKSTRSSMDTHAFAGENWEGALIQDKEELHLHIRSNDDPTSHVPEPIDLIDRIARAVAFTHGFQPWPVYREIRIDHRVVERWLAPNLNLSQMYIAPVSDSLGATIRSNPGSELRNIIPTIADGLGRLPEADQQRLATLLWNVRWSALGDSPGSVKLLILCAAFEGLMKLIAGDSQATARTIWRAASKRLGLSWEKWTSEIFELWKKHRNDLSHGRLWLPEEATPNDFFTDYPRLGCAFMTVVAALCGYEGPILADPFEPRAVVIQNLKATA